jgi:hypothetical protein
VARAQADKVITVATLPRSLAIVRPVVAVVEEVLDQAEPPAQALQVRSAALQLHMLLVARDKADVAVNPARTVLPTEVTGVAAVLRDAVVGSVVTAVLAL